MCSPSGTMRIANYENATLLELEAAVRNGGRLVFYEYCISCIVLTLRRPSDIYLLKSGDKGFVHGIPFVLTSLLLGWWGLPWGMIHTPLVLLTNLAGGCDVTDEILGRMRASMSREAAPCEP
jgi:hypothetical protein